MFRRVDLPARVAGRLLLHSMPGRFEAIEKVWHQVKSDAVGAIVCLTESYEIELKSAQYAAALEDGTVPCAVLPFEIREGGVPEDRDAFWGLANDIAKRLRCGEAAAQFQDLFGAMLQRTNLPDWRLRNPSMSRTSDR